MTSMYPAHRSATRRRELRRLVRGALGTSSDPAPEAQSCLRAARVLSDLLHLASNGRYRLEIIDRHAGAVPYHEAMREARGQEER